VRRIRPLLASGRTAPLDLWRFLESVAENEAWDWRYSDSADSAAALHVWERFLAEHEEDVAGFLEAAYALMLETHLDPEDVSMGSLEILSPTYGAHLIAALPPGRLRATRAVLRRLVKDGETLPQERRHSIRAELERVLAAWALSVSTTEARRELGSGSATTGETLALFGRIPRQEVDRYDPVATIVHLLDGEGDWDEFLRSLHWLRDEHRGIATGTLATLDEAVIAFTGRTHFTRHPKRLWRYLTGTTRGGWPAAEEFMDAALDAGAHALTHVPLALLFLKPEPPKHYLRDLLGRYRVPKHVRAALDAHLAK
jgi:hypothetical protein